MKQKLNLVSEILPPPPKQSSFSELMAEIEADKKKVQIEKEKKRKQKEEAKKNQRFDGRLISRFWILFVPTGFYFLVVDPAVVVLMIAFVICVAYIKNFASKAFGGGTVSRQNNVWRILYQDRLFALTNPVFLNQHAPNIKHASASEGFNTEPEIFYVQNL